MTDHSCDAAARIADLLNCAVSEWRSLFAPDREEIENALRAKGDYTSIYRVSVLADALSSVGEGEEGA